VIDYGTDIYTEPDGSEDTLANLGPLRTMAGVFEGAEGIDEHPAADGVERNTFFEHYELYPIDRQTNGPQLFYGLRYHTHIVKPGEVETFRHAHARDSPRAGLDRLRGCGRHAKEPRSPAAGLT
jgi:hypothetical protein